MPSILSAQLVVSTPFDEDDGDANPANGTGTSLREAIKYAPADSTITFDASLSGQAVAVNLGEIGITRNVTIDGSALPELVSLDANSLNRHFRTSTNTTVQITAVALVNGRTSADGGSIRNQGNLTLNSVTVSNNYSEFFGGAFSNVEGSMTLSDSMVESNSAGASGGVFFAIGGVMVVNNTTFRGNTAILNGGVLINVDGAVTIQNSTFEDNSAATNGGAIYSQVSSLNSKTTVRQSTFFNNTAAGAGGAIYNSNGDSELILCTITGNTAPEGQGSGIASNGSGADTFVRQSIIAGNTNSDVDLTGSEASNTFVSQGHNLIGTGDAVSAFNAIGDLTGISDPQLAALGSYGGPTQTMPPLPGSPAIDSGGATALTNDQRGFPRVFGSSVDIGATEFQGGSDVDLFWATDWDNDGRPFGTENAVGTDPTVPDADPTTAYPADTGNGIEFGFNPDAADYTAWIVVRSLDLSVPNNFVEIYRYDGPTGQTTADPEISFTPTAGTIQIIDNSTPQSPQAFYQLLIERSE